MAEKFKVGLEALGPLHADSQAPHGYEISDDEVIADVHADDSPYFVSIVAAAAVVPAAATSAASAAAAAASGDTSRPAQMELDGDATTGPAEPANKPAAVASPNAKPAGPPNATLRLFCRYRRGEAGEPLATWLQATVHDLVAQVGTLTLGTFRLSPSLSVSLCLSASLSLCLSVSPELAPRPRPPPSLYLPLHIYIYMYLSPRRFTSLPWPLFALARGSAPSQPPTVAALLTLCFCRRRCRRCVALQARKTLKIPADLQLSLSTETSSLDGRSQATIEACGVRRGDEIYATIYAPGDDFFIVASLERKHLQEALRVRGVTVGASPSPTTAALREQLDQELVRVPRRLKSSGSSLCDAVEAWQPTDCQQTPAALATFLS